MRTFTNIFTKRNVFGYGQDRAVVTIGEPMLLATQHLRALPTLGHARSSWRRPMSLVAAAARSVEHYCSILAGTGRHWQPVLLMFEPSHRS